MNFGNIGTMMKLQSALKTFNANHPRVMPFFKAVGAEGVKDGSLTVEYQKNTLQAL